MQGTGEGAEVECAQMTDERISGATRRQAREDSPAVSLLIEKYGPLRDDIRTLLNEIDHLPEEVRRLFDAAGEKIERKAAETQALILSLRETVD